MTQQQLPAPATPPSVFSRSLTTDKSIFRRNCFDALWLLINEAGGKLTIGAGRLKNVPADALICRTDHPDGSVTFERGPKR